MAGDSSFDSVVLHLPFDGPNNGTDIRDRSNSRKAVTVVGGAKLSTAQAASLTGNTTSLILDGAGDYLTVPDSADWNFGSGSFTFECWFKRASSSGNYMLLSQLSTAGGANYNGFQIYSNATGVHFTGYNTNTGVTRSYSVAADTSWHHFSVGSDGTNTFISFDGVVTSYALAPVGNSTQTLAIGIDWDRATSGFNGHIDDLRITKAAVRYTTTFSIPTEPNPIGLATVTDTDYSSVSLLINADGSTIADESPSLKTVTAVGGAALSKVDSKVGAGSVAFDGTGDYLTTTQCVPTTGAFTVEAWVKLTSHSPTAGEVIVGQGSGATAGRFNLWVHSSQKLAVGIGGLDITGTTTVGTGSWNHVAAVRDGSNNLSLYLNGSLEGTIVDSTAIEATDTWIGYLTSAASSGAGEIAGYMDSVRITSGVARYTSTFAPPNYVLFRADLPIQGTVTLTGLTPGIPTPFTGTPTQRQITVTGQTPGLPVPFTGTPTQRQITLTGQTPGLPVPFTGTPTQRQITVTGQTPTIDVAAQPTADVTGRGFKQTVTITSLAEGATVVSGRGFSSTPELYGGSVITGIGFATVSTIAGAADQTAYVTGRGFASPASLVLDAQFYLSVTGRGFQTVPRVFGAADIAGRSFKSLVSISAVAPTSFRVTGQTFVSPATITAQAINSAVITGRGFVSGIAYSRITGRGFATKPVIKAAFTAEYAEAFVMNLVQVTASERRKTTTYAVTRYQNYPFQHIAKIGANYYGFKSDGVYQLTGDYDVEEDVLVNGTIQLNEDDLGAFNSQNIPYIYLNGDDDYSATAFVDDVQQPTFTSGFGGRRVKGARGSKGRYWYFKIEGIKKLQGVEYRPDSLSRKVK